MSRFAWSARLESWTPPGEFAATCAASASASSSSDLGGDDAVDESDPLGLLSLDEPAREGDLGGAAGSDQPRQVP